MLLSLIHRHKRHFLQTAMLVFLLIFSDLLWLQIPSPEIVLFSQSESFDAGCALAGALVSSHPHRVQRGKPFHSIVFAVTCLWGSGQSLVLYGQQTGLMESIHVPQNLLSSCSAPHSLLWSGQCHSFSVTGGHMVDKEGVVVKGPDESQLSLSHPEFALWTHIADLLHGRQVSVSSHHRKESLH